MVSNDAVSTADGRLLTDLVDRGLRRFEQDDPRGARWGEAKVRRSRLLYEARRPRNEPQPPLVSPEAREEPRISRTGRSSFVRYLTDH